MLLREQPAGLIHAAAHDVRVHVHAARHHHHALGIEPPRVGLHIRYDASILDTDVVHLSVNPVRGIVDDSSHDADLLAGAHRAASRSARPCTTDNAVVGPESGTASGRGTSSMRNAVPGSWIPATPVSTAITGANPAVLARGPIATVGT